MIVIETKAEFPKNRARDLASKPRSQAKAALDTYPQRGVVSISQARWADSHREKNRKVARHRGEHQTEPRAGMRHSVRARPLKGLAGRLFPPLWATRNKQSDCPQNPAHLLDHHGTTGTRYHYLPGALGMRRRPVAMAASAVSEHCSTN